MSAQALEIARGTGSLRGGGIRLRDIPYRLLRGRDGRAAAGAGAGPLEGELDITGLAEATVLAGVDDLVLELEDGGRLTIALTSSTGHFAVRGVGPGADGVREFARRYTEAWCSQNAASVAAFFAPDGSLAVNDAAPAVGRAAITAVAQGFMTAFPDLRVLMDDVRVEGDRTIYRWTLVGTNTGPGGTGRPVRISGFEEWTLSADGLVAQSRGHFDAADYQRQLDGRAS